MEFNSFAKSSGNGSSMENCKATPQQLKGGCKKSVGSAMMRTPQRNPSAYLKRSVENNNLLKSCYTGLFHNNENRSPKSVGEKLKNQVSDRTKSMIEASKIMSNNEVGIWSLTNNSTLKKTSVNIITTHKTCKSSESPVQLPANSSVTITPAPSTPVSLLKRQSNLSIDDKKRTPLAPLVKKTSFSSVLHGVSSTMIDKAYGPSSSPSEKENVPVELIPEKPIPAHLLGFPNLGNTCYLNAVLQSLVSVRVFRCDVTRCVQREAPAATTLLHALRQLLHARKTGVQNTLKQPLRLLKENFEKLDRSFMGWKMQDANEFLTKVLDTMKDEVDKLHLDAEEICNESTNKIENKSPQSIITSNFNVGESKLLNNSVLIRCVPHNRNKQDNSCGSVSSSLHNKRKRHFSGEQDGGSKRRLGSTSGDASSQADANKANNPITANFSFQLKEVYRCLGCAASVERSQDYYSLYVHLSVSCADEDESPGPASLRAAVAQYMKQELRDLKCEKCGHEKAQVTTHFTKLPRILIIQVKRYKFIAAEYSSLKVCSTIDVSQSLDLAPHCVDDTKPYTPVWGDQGRSAPPTPCKTTPFKQRIAAACPSPAPPDPTTSTEDAKEEEPKLTEEEEFQEALRRSLDDSHSTSLEEINLGDGDEEDDLQKAIRLSLEEANKLLEQQQQQQQQQQQLEHEVGARHKNVDCSEGCLDGNDAAADDDENSNGPHLYKLASIVSHFGLNTTTGHYTCDVLSEGRQWLHYDDELVTEVPHTLVLGDSRKRNGYIFFYIHKDLTTDK